MASVSQLTCDNPVIVAESLDTAIWLRDHEGHFVQKETGARSTGLLPGTFVVEFDLGAPQYEVGLAADSYHAEAELRASQPFARHVPKLPP